MWKRKFFLACGKTFMQRPILGAFKEELSMEISHRSLDVLVGPEFIFFRVSVFSSIRM